MQGLSKSEQGMKERKSWSSWLPLETKHCQSSPTKNMATIPLPAAEIPSVLQNAIATKLKFSHITASGGSTVRKPKSPLPNTTCPAPPETSSAPCAKLRSKLRVLLHVLYSAPSALDSREKHSDQPGQREGWLGKSAPAPGHAPQARNDSKNVSTSRLYNPANTGVQPHKLTQAAMQEFKSSSSRPVAPRVYALHNAVN